MQIIKLSFQKQKYESETKQLTKRKQELSQQWCHLLKRSTIKKFAKDRLKMSKVKFSQIKRIQPDE